jgi:RsiW-degrading membrane proteinase PrsW (M82 family)
VGFEYIGPLPNPDAQPQDIPARPSLVKGDEDTQPKRQKQATASNSNTVEPSYREHSSSSTSLPPLTPSFYPPHFSYQQQPGNQPQLPVPSSPGWQSYQPLPAAQPSAQPQQQPYPAMPMPSSPGWQSYQPPPAAQQQPYLATPAPPYPPAGYPPAMQHSYGYHGYGYAQAAPPTYPGYSGSWPPYSPYPQVWQPPRPRRDGYQLSIAIISTICSGLVMLAGLFCGFVLLILAVGSPTLSHLGPNERFSGTVIYTMLTIIGLVGGSSSLYHSIRTLLRKQSAPFKLPWSWLFLVFYMILLAIGFTIGSTPQVLANQPLKIFLIVLSGIFPALTFLALAVRRIHYPQLAPWPTTWRRFTLAIVSGGTVTIVLAVIFELVLTQLAGTAFGVHTSIIDNLNMPVPHNPQELLFSLVLVSVIAPIVEECVKPLAVVVMIGRLRSAAEAFILGFACGIGFDLIETSGYISLGDSRPWIDTALERSTAGLLHGFGAGMVALGCYYLTRRNSINNHRILIGLGCIAYAIIQHGIWNGAFLFALLPAPVGPFLENGTVGIGSYVMQGIVVVYIVESLVMFAFFLFVIGKLRPQSPKATRQRNQTSARAVNTAPIPISQW